MTYQPVDRGPLDSQFWEALAHLGAYAERRNLKYTIGSEVRPARRNPLYTVPPARPRHPSQQRGAVRIPRQRKPAHDQMSRWVPGPALYDPTKGRATPSWQQ